MRVERSARRAALCVGLAWVLAACSSGSPTASRSGPAIAVGPFQWERGALVHHGAHGLSATFGSSGVRLATGRLDASLRLERFGRRDALAASASTPAIADARGAHFDHAGYTEWWRPEGNALEQGITVTTAPVGEGPIVAELSVGGGLVAKLERGDVFLRDRNDVARVAIGKLLAVDANGRRLPSHFEVSDGRFAMVVDDAGAQYPVTIDPIVGTENELLPADLADGSAFGASVAFGTKRLVVGATGEVVGATATGAAYVFDQDATGAWNQVARLSPSDSMMSMNFGASVAVNGDEIVVGAPGVQDASGNMDVGKVYVFTRSAAGVWSQTQGFFSAEADSGGQFGASVALDGTTLVVGAPYGVRGTGASASNDGEVYVYLADATGKFNQQQKLAPTRATGTANLRFGQSVALSDVGGNTLLVVGEPGAQSGTGYDSGGAAAFFSRAPSATTWSLVQDWQPADSAGSDYAGFSVAIDGAQAVVSASGKSTSSSSAGVVYVLARDATSGKWAQTDEVLANADTNNADQFGYSVAIKGGIIAAGAINWTDASGTALQGGAAYVLQKGASGWTQRHVRPSDAAASEQCGNAIAFDGSRVLVGASRRGDAAGHSFVGAAYLFDPALGLAVGATCARPDDCGSGFCVDGVCCDKACTGQCEACSAAGACGPLDHAAPHAGKPACTAPYKTCTAGACSTSCASDADCDTGAHCDATMKCVSNGNIGDACGKGTECGSGFCVDGFCCDTACTDVCASCGNATSKGHCGPVVPGAPVGSRSCGGAEAGASNECGAACDGSDQTACHLAGATVKCTNKTCSGSTFTTDGTCDGKGGCNAAPNKCPGYLVCDATTQACKTTCATDADCVAGSKCASGKCSTPLPSMCSADGSATVTGSTSTPCNTGYLCDNGTGYCRISCTATSDCAPGYACDTTSGHCNAASNGSSGGCSVGVPASSTATGAVGFALALAGLIARRRRTAREG